MTTLAVDKIRKKVRISLANQSQLIGHVFLSPCSQAGIGQETVLDVLTGPNRFIPFEAAVGEITFINIQQIAWLETDWEDNPGHEMSGQADRMFATVFLRSGERHRGEILMALPRDKSRLSDCLNQIDRFMVFRSKERQFLINVDYIVRVV